MRAVLCPGQRRVLAPYRLLGIHCVLVVGSAVGSLVLADDQQWSTRKLDHLRSLPNAFQVHPRVVSGGVPNGDAGFRQLRQLGIKTIISVDGARPDLQRAARYGLRYVHLPHGYDGIPEARRKALAKAVLELPGPIYVHCHHGKHRSPAAAIVASVGAGLVEPGRGVAFLHAAGTSERYAGLYAAAQSANRFNPSELRSYQVAFPEVAQVAPLAAAMVDIERAFDRLRAAGESGWPDTSTNPESGPMHQALLLQEHFAELLRLRADHHPKDFRQMLTQSRDAASTLATTLEARPLTSQSRSSLGDSLSKLQTNCRRCHQLYRDQ